MKVAFGHLHFPPDVFWTMSLREWQATLKGYIEKNYGHVEKPMSRSSLNKLMKEYPDDRKAA